MYGKYELRGAVAEIAYLDFDLEIERAAQGYRIEVNSPAGQTTSAFTLPFSDLELENFLLRMGQQRRGVRRAGSPEVETARAFGARLFDALFAGEARACLRSSLDEATGQGKGLRIRLRLNDAPELADIPWEYLYNPALNRFLALSATTPLVRYLELPARIQPLAVTPPLRVLVMIASPRDQAPLDVEREWALLRQALADLEARGLVQIERLDQPALPALQRWLRRGSYHILHFIGHGGFDARTDDGVLVLEDEDRNGYRIGGQDLGMLLHDHRSLRLVVLNACEGARASRSDPFAGTAQSLVQQGLPAVIAMQFAVSDEAAIDLSREFYGALADGYPVDAALAEARKAIFAAGSGAEWGTPVLYLRAPDGRIFDVAPGVARSIDGEQPHTLVAQADESPVSAKAPAQLVPNLRTSIQMRLATLGCQANLLVQIAALVLVVTTGWFFSSFLRDNGTSAQPTSQPALTALPAETEEPAPTRTPAAATSTTSRSTSTPAPPAATSPPTATSVPSPTPETYAGWGQRASIAIGKVINTVAFSPDGALLALASSDDALVRLRSGADGAALADGELTSGGPGNDRVTSLAFAPDGTLLATANGDGSIQLWDVAERRAVRLMIDYDDRERRAVQSVAFSHDGRLLAAGYDDTAVRLWRVIDGTLLLKLTGHSSPVWGVAFSPDDALLASVATSDPAVRLWRVADGTVAGQLEGHTAGVLSVAFAPSGTVLASGANDATVRLWDVADGRLLHTLVGHPLGVGSLAFAPDGATLATAAGDGNARLWDVAGGTLLRAFEGHTSWVSSVAFAPDGKLLASGSADGTLRLWGPP